MREKETRTIDGHRFKEVAHKKRKSEAQQKAEQIRKGGRLARVIKEPKEGGVYAVYKGPQRK